VYGALYERRPCTNPRCDKGRLRNSKRGKNLRGIGDHDQRADCPECDGYGYQEIRVRKPGNHATTNGDET
jgi:hypothetical protein